MPQPDVVLPPRALVALAAVLALLGFWGLSREAPPAARDAVIAGCPVRVHGEGAASIICVHSVFQGRETAWPLASALARGSDLAAYNLLLQGPGPFSDYERQLETLASELRRTGPVALVGHSMGADLACAVARRRPDLIAATVAVGFPIPDADAPPQLLRAVGVWDELHSISETEATLVLPCADHNLENFDADLFGAAGTWTRARLGLPAPPPPLRPTPYLCQGLLTWAGLLLMLAVPASPRARLLAGTLAALLFVEGRGWWLGAVLRPNRSSLAWVTLGLLATAAALVANAVGNLARNPAWLLDLPGFFLAAAPLYLMKLSSALSPPVVLSLSALEVWRPGVLWHALLLIPRAFRQAATRLEPRLRGEVQPAQLALLGLLLLAALGAWSQTLGAGYALEPGDILRLLGKAGALLVLPLVVLVLGVRHPYFRALALLALLGTPTLAEPRTWRAGWTTQELEQQLATGKIRSIHRLQDALGASWDGSNEFHVLELESGLKAVFRSEDEPWGSMAELAGYRMDGYLGTQLVPPTVERRLRDEEVPAWPWGTATRPGTAQLWVETGPVSEASLADVEVLSFLMGRYDNHSGNLLYDRAGRPVVVDFESSMDLQQVRYGDFPFVRRGGVHKDPAGLPASAPFPFDHPQKLRNPTLAQIQQRFGPWWNQIWPQGMSGLHRMLAHIPGRVIPYAIWDDSLWVQVRVKSRHPACTTVCPPSTLARLRLLESPQVAAMLPLPMGPAHVRGVMERRAQILRCQAGPGGRPQIPGASQTAYMRPVRLSSSPGRTSSPLRDAGRSSDSAACPAR